MAPATETELNQLRNEDSLTSRKLSLSTFNCLLRLDPVEQRSIILELIWFSFLKEIVLSLREEMRLGFMETRAEFRSEMKRVENELKSDIQRVEAKFEVAVTDLKGDVKCSVTIDFSPA